MKLNFKVEKKQKFFIHSSLHLQMPVFAGWTTGITTDAGNFISCNGFITRYSFANGEDPNFLNTVTVMNQFKVLKNFLKINKNSVNCLETSTFVIVVTQ